MLSYTHPLTTLVMCLVLGVIMASWEIIEKQNLRAGVHCLKMVSIISIFLVSVMHLIYLMAPKMWAN